MGIQLVYTKDERELKMKLAQTHNTYTERY